MEEMLGMTTPSWKSRENEELGRVAYRDRLEMQLKAEKELDDTIKAQKQKVVQMICFVCKYLTHKCALFMGLYLRKVCASLLSEWCS